MISNNTLCPFQNKSWLQLLNCQQLSNQRLDYYHHTRESCPWSFYCRLLIIITFFSDHFIAFVNKTVFSYVFEYFFYLFHIISGSHFLFIMHGKLIVIILNLVIVIEFQRRLMIIKLSPLLHSNKPTVTSQQPFTSPGLP